MVTIQLSDKLVERLRSRGVEDIERFVEAVIERMDDEAIEQAYEPVNFSIALEEDVEDWMAKLDQAIAEIREGLSPEELQTVIKMMNEEYIEPIDSAFWNSDLPEDTL